MKDTVLLRVRSFAEGARAVFHSPFFFLGIVGLLILLFGLWLVEHDARVRRSYELAQMRKQTTAEISTLEKQAEAAVREANERHSQAIRNLESRQKKLLEASARLRERLAALQKEERAKVEQAATLPTEKVATEVAARLGLPPESVQRATSPTTTAAKVATSGEPSTPPSSEGSEGRVEKPRATQLTLDEPALRRVDAALAELDSCREQHTVLTEQIANCDSQVAAQADSIKQQAASIEKLRQALTDKDQILARLQEEHRAELKAARGTRWGRWKRTLEHIALGIAIGVVIR